MAFDKDSPEARLGRLGEIAVKRWALSQGWLVLDASTMGTGATTFHCAGGKVIALDQLHLRQGVSRWVDIKAKLGPVLFQKEHVLRHGIDLRPWRHYLEIWRQSGSDAFLAIVELRRHRVESGYDPRLLMQSLARLQEVAHVDPKPTESFSSGGIFWDRGDFEDCGMIEMTVTAIPETQQHLHPWEGLSKLGSPPVAYQRTYQVPRSKCRVCDRDCGYFERDGLFYCWQHKP